MNGVCTWQPNIVGLIAAISLLLFGYFLGKSTSTNSVKFCIKSSSRMHCSPFL